MTTIELDLLRSRVCKAILPIRQTDKKSVAPNDFLFIAQRTKAGSELPQYYLIYFLLVDLLKFPNLGSFEKVSWSVPIDCNGKVFVLEHRKFGVGLFVDNPDLYENDAKLIVSRLMKGIKIAQPYFEWCALQAVEKSALNVTNKSNLLFKKFEYFLTNYEETAEEAIKRAKEFYVEKISDDGMAKVYNFPAFELSRNAKWLALAAIDSFFTWTEHIFIHLAILLGKISTGLEVANLAEAEWRQKFKIVFNLKDAKSKSYFDKLLLIRRQLRNYMAHGAFGKSGEAFHFHSGAGAVPVLLPHKTGRNRFTMTDDLRFDEAVAIEIIESFINYIWSGEREPARFYIQENDLPVILTMAQDGSYGQAMKSVKKMKKFIELLSGQWNRSVNMDF